MPWFSAIRVLVLTITTFMVTTIITSPTASADITDYWGKEAKDLITSTGNKRIPARPSKPDTDNNESPPVSASANNSSTNTAQDPIRLFWLHLNDTPISDKMLETQAKLRSYIVLNAWESELIPKFKASNPAVQVFVYKDLTSTRSYACRDGVDDEQLPTGVGYCYADKHHPDWFLTSPSRQRLEYSGYPGHWQMDVGNPAYQKMWAKNVITSSKEAGFDGVYMDNALFPCDAYHKGVCPAQYSSDQAIQTAYKSMLANTHSTFTNAGLKTVANLSNARLYEGAWDAYMEHLDGGFDEWWLSFGSDNLLSEYPAGWNRQVAQITANEAKGKITWVQPHFAQDDDRAFWYTLASYLMASGSQAAIAEIERTDGYGNPSPRHNAHDWELGSPKGPYRAVGKNLFRRDFTCGAVVVNANPTNSRAVTITLDDTYLNKNDASVSSVNLSGTSGAVLRKPC